MSNLPKTLNDKAWEKLFDKYNILTLIEKNGIYEITAKEINEFREARLMTKFDHKSNLPNLFLKNKLAILPITRGSYVISNFQAYHKFEKPSNNIIEADFPDYIQSINPEDITSESTAINVAYLSGMLADFTDEERLFPTVNGRMSSASFKFNISNSISSLNIPISVINSQLEIDGGYEGLESLSLIEAKNSISDDFLIRQLYYPYRLWQNKIEKTIKPIFLIYSNGIFYLYEYKFHDPHNYNSLLLVKQQNYTLENDEITIEELISIAQNVTITPEPAIPFPQADSFARVINICELLNEHTTLTREEITYNYDFDIRQTNYYTDACRYLGLVYKVKNKDVGISYYLTEKGQHIFNLTLRKRKLTFAKCILEKNVFNKIFNEYINLLEMPPKTKIVTLMKESNLYHISSEDTYYRRASSISSWINWILDLQR